MTKIGISCPLVSIPYSSESSRPSLMMI